MEDNRRVNSASAPALSGRVASLHLPPPEPGAPLRSVESVEVVQAKGILNEPRYFARISRTTGQPSRRQITLIGREQIAEHAAALCIATIPAGAVRANIETVGIDLVACVGQVLQIGDAALLVFEPRMPCEKMDAICAGLRERMKNNRQGVLAEVLRSGMIRVGDAVII